MMCDNSFLKCFLLLASVTLYFPGFPTHLAAFLNSPLLGYSLLTFKYLSSTEYRYPNSALYLSLLPEGFSYHMQANNSQILHCILVSDYSFELQTYIFNYLFNISKLVISFSQLFFFQCPRFSVNYIIIFSAIQDRHQESSFIFFSLLCTTTNPIASPVHSTFQCLIY